MHPKTRQTLSEILHTQSIPGRDDLHIARNFERLRSVLDAVRHTPEQEEVYAHVHFYLEQTANRASRFLLSPQLTSSSARQGLFAIRDQAMTTIEEYFLQAPPQDQLIVSGRGHSASSAVGELSPKPFKHIPYSVVRIPAGHNREVYAQLARQGGCQKEKRYHVRPQQSTGSHEWPLKLVCAPQAWDTTRGEGVRVAVLDTGVDYTHPSLANRFTQNKGYDFIHNTPQPRDDNGHGTHVAGSIASERFGVAPDATLYALKFLNQHGSGGEVDLLRALEWCYDHNVNIVNASFGSSHPSQAEKAACDFLAKNNILIVAAAGNDGNTKYSYPASYDSVVSVAAVDKHKKHARFSQANNQVNIASPGVEVNSCYPNNTTKYLSGTSMATPHVAGGAALVFAQQPTSGYVREVLDVSAENLGDAHKFGSGLLRCDKAAQVAQLHSRWKQ